MNVPVTLGQITVKDGTSNTMAMVENPQPVPWYKPEDVAFDVAKPFPVTKGMWTNNRVQVAFFDGSIRTLLLGVDEEIAKALVTWDGAEDVNVSKVID
jgi:prepilin-type processing-associated H-X9-DG protein